jgi:alkanesulfonate monooxygenase SsuD/methylene tetrahydromethanopterin reductase-like flavin-dependent oxidoreductase (luciferase family)
MDIGLGLWTMRSPAAMPASTPLLYGELMRDARRAEALGFHSVWVAEHHFWYDGWCPAPLTAAACVLSVTSTLRVGTGIHLLAVADHEQVAEEVEALHELSGGRLEYGVGLGYRAAEYDGYGLSRTVRGRRMDAALDHLLERWGPQGGDAPTVWVGGFAEPVLRRVGTRGLSTMLPSTLTIEQIEAAITQVRAHADAAGRRPGRAAVMKYAWVSDSERELRRARATHVALTKEYTGAWFPLGGRPGFESPELVDRQVQRALDTALIGTTDEVIAGLRRLEQAGADLVVLHLLGDGRSSDTAGAMRLMADAIVGVAA